MCFWVFFLEVLDCFQELPASVLFEEAHQVGRKRLLGGDWDLEYLETALGEEATLLILQHIGTVDC